MNGLLSTPLRERFRRLIPIGLRARHHRTFLPRLPPILNLAPPGKPCPRKALFSFKTASFHLAPDDAARANFSHEGIGPAIVSALHELGYSVDVVDYQHPAPLIDRNYDLFVGHMGINFELIAQQLPPHVPRIYFATTMPWRLNNQNEWARLAALRTRRGTLLPEERIIFFSEDAAYATATGIICTGNGLSKSAFANFPRVFPIGNAARPELRDATAGKDFQAALKNFLFFAGPGSVHKGLDLLLEIFPRLCETGMHLHVCQIISQPFAEIYRRELYHTPNIHCYGNILPRSREYYEIFSKCGFLVSPSCAEGGQGAVVEAYHQGLIPVISRECTIDPGINGFQLPDCGIPAIEQALRVASALNPENLRQRAGAIQSEARTKYSEPRFKALFKAAASEILAYHQTIRP